MFSATSDPYLLAALWAGTIALGLTVALAAVIVVLRLNLQRQERRWSAFVERWRPLLLAMMMEPDEPPTLPALARSERTLFLRLWVYLHESVRGTAAEELNQAARVLQIDRTARRLLVRGTRAERLQAVLALGYLRDEAAWDALLKLARRADGLVSVNAARALIQIDAFKGAETLMPLILSRRDWDVSRVAAFLVEARDAFWLHLVRQLPSLPPRDLPRALRLADALRLKLPASAVRVLLQPGQPAAVVKAALRLVSTGELLDDVRACLQHPDWRVREQAAQQLAQQATPDDIPALARQLDDPRWDVRMGAAQALAQLPFLSDEQLTEFGRPGTASDTVVRHVLAERTWA
ncbi:HEAT repeat domain-containing protein [Hydrogenophaga sp.]|uniref:HEAT repeat domain-containing protein n=1 Tax=Hydrogenophaga sp. TaxID=1904254 RepID=UPI003AF8F04D